MSLVQKSAQAVGCLNDLISVDVNAKQMSNGILTGYVYISGINSEIAVSISARPLTLDTILELDGSTTATIISQPFLFVDLVVREYIPAIAHVVLKSANSGSIYIKVIAIEGGAALSETAKSDGSQDFLLFTTGSVHVTSSSAAKLAA